MAWGKEGGLTISGIVTLAGSRFVAIETRVILKLTSLEFESTKVPPPNTSNSYSSFSFPVSVRVYLGVSH